MNQPINKRLLMGKCCRKQVQKQKPHQQRIHHRQSKILTKNETIFTSISYLCLLILFFLQDQSRLRSTSNSCTTSTGSNSVIAVTFVFVSAAQHNPYHTYQLYHSTLKRTTKSSTKSQEYFKSTRDTASCTLNDQYQIDEGDYCKDAVLVSSNTAPWRTNNNNRQRSRSTSVQQRRDEYFKTKERINDYSYRILDVDDIKNDRRVQVYDPSLKRRKRKNQQLSWTNKIIWITIGMYGLQILRPAITQYGMKLSNRILDGSQLYRLLTPIVLHGSIFHLMTNMISLSRIGNDVEQLFGSSRYICTYLGAGIVGNYISAIQSKNPSLGASGSVFGIVGSYFIFLNRNEWLLGSYGRSMTDSIIQTTIMNVFLGFMNPQIDQWAHLGGAIGGATISYLFGPRLYILDTTGAGLSISSPSKLVVDRPIARVPKSIELIPKQINDNYTQVSKQISSLINTILPANGGMGGNKNVPWQKRVMPKSSLKKHVNKHRLIDTSRSLEPGPVD
jgi:membrane associated rhomboid family serine protease